jgi:hypothetical protein
MTEDYSRTRAYEPGSNPIPPQDPNLNATRPYTPGMPPQPNWFPPHQSPPLAQPPHGQAPYGQPPQGQPPQGQPPQGQPPYGQPPQGQQPYSQPAYGPPSSSPPPYAPPPVDVAQDRARAQRGLVFGVLWLVGGLALSLITYSMASRSGGVYFVAYGPVIYGVIRIVISLIALAKTRS